MKKLLMIGLTVLIISSFQKKNEVYRYIPNKVFGPGEKVEYKIHYSIFTAAIGKVVVSDELYNVHDRTCFKIDIYGETVGLFDLIVRVRDNWRSYLDTASIVPQRFHRTLEEGSYRKYETTEFDHAKDTAMVTTLDKVTKEVATIEYFKTPDNVQDLVSGYYYLRLLDLNDYNIGDTISVDAFMDDESYDFKIKYIGKETIKTKIGKINALVMSPIMPENKLFNGEESIKFWVSDDINKIPLKVKAQMFIGAVEVDITSYNPG